METQAMTIRLPVELYERLRREAFEGKTSQNAIIVEELTERYERFADPAALAQAIASALESAAAADWETEPGDGKQIEIYASQIAPIVARVLSGGEQ